VLIITKEGLAFNEERNTQSNKRVDLI